MDRRAFIHAVGASVAAFPVSGRAQPAGRVVGVIMNGSPANQEQQQLIAFFKQVLQQLGWTEGRDLRIDIRWGGGDPATIRRHARELVAVSPSVVVATGNAGMTPLMEATQSVPIVFCNIADPVGAGFVESMARPGGNATGFIQFEYTLSGKWAGLLKEIAPQVTRLAVLRDPALTAGIGQFAVIQSVASPLGMEVSAISVRDAAEIERGVTKFARGLNGGLILTASALAVVHSELIVGLAARYKLPMVSYRRYFVDSGGLISYGYNAGEQYRGVAGYVDRILKGTKPADLPVQAPTKYELIFNMKTAKALSLIVPPALLARADEVIE
jgi:ABC-type uncharacterized transport system substrate-binding protein